MKHRLMPGGSLGYVDEAGDVIIVRPGDVLIPPGHLLEAHPERFEPLEATPRLDDPGGLGTPLPADFPGKEALEAPARPRRGGSSRPSPSPPPPVRPDP